jgi:hypothetical protein
MTMVITIVIKGRKQTPRRFVGILGGFAVLTSSIESELVQLQRFFGRLQHAVVRA